MTNAYQSEFVYDVALSFAGEDRMHAEKLAQLLEAKSITIFYDEAKAADLWGKELIVHLAEIYGKQALFCVMFVSKYYPLKRWTNHERLHAQARAFRDPNEYILPLRLDDTEVPGLAETIGYRDLRQHSIESIADLLEEKIAKAQGKVSTPSAYQNSGAVHNLPTISSIPLPKRKKTFTQFEKDQFSREAFEYVKQYFRQGLRDLEVHYPDVKTNLTEVTNLEFISKIYLQGNTLSQCAIWLGDNLTPNTIYYSEDSRRLGHNTSFHDYLPVVESGDELRLQIGTMGLGIVRVDEPLATKEQAAEYLWKRTTRQLDQR